MRANTMVNNECKLETKNGMFLIAVTKKALEFPYPTYPSHTISYTQREIYQKVGGEGGTIVIWST